MLYMESELWVYAWVYAKDDREYRFETMIPEVRIKDRQRTRGKLCLIMLFENNC
jgi:hypothetical protein